ncbi:hypothetical protein ACH5RR_034638 [Cinchona calisaya]|uniref:RING-type E3 ubiquitin transferase n=1 Tax=Cinchona calisaya TaxID=153742 RepID=A0ABD2YFZ7_9GENT
MTMMKHRKLFPTSKDNNTLSCPDICDSTCPYGCDPYEDVYSTSPPPPPPPQLAPNLSARQGQQISPYVIVIVTLIGSCFLVISYLAVKYFHVCNRFRARQRHQEEANDEEFLDENRGPAIDHPIWYINTIGLQPSVIDSITIFRYLKGDRLIEGTECSVCLNSFQNDETLRLLPKCSHAFHIPCIDTWLRSHTNCPVCRAGIISTTTPVASNSLNSNNLGLDGDSREENLENDQELDIHQQIRDDEFCENRTDTGEIIEFPQVLDDLKDKFTRDGENYEVQSTRRSVSVDSLLAANISGAVLNLRLTESEDVSPNVGGNSTRSRILKGASSMTQYLHKKPVRMKRSFSYSGRSFLSRQNSRNN